MGNHSLFLPLQENANDCGGASVISLSVSLFLTCLSFSKFISWWKTQSYFACSHVEEETQETYVLNRGHLKWIFYFPWIYLILHIWTHDDYKPVSNDRLLLELFQHWLVNSWKLLQLNSKSMSCCCHGYFSLSYILLHHFASQNEMGLWRCRWWLWRETKKRELWVTRCDKIQKGGTCFPKLTDLNIEAHVHIIYAASSMHAAYPEWFICRLFHFVFKHWMRKMKEGLQFCVILLLKWHLTWLMKLLHLKAMAQCQESDHHGATKHHIIHER